MADKLRLLVLSRTYPNNVMELLGLWVQSQVQHMARTCEVKVISPVPYCPPVPGLSENYTRFRRVPVSHWDGEVEVLHPRMVVGPGYSTHSWEWWLLQASIRKTADRLRERFPFDLIHAHFTYPDGVAAVELGAKYGVPVVITEQNPWGPWLKEFPAVLEKSIWAAKQCTAHLAVSTHAKETIEGYAGKRPNLSVIPDGIHADHFTLPEAGQRRNPQQILFAGAIRPVKGVDVLLEAMQKLVTAGRDVRLIIAGEAYFGPYRREEQRLKQVVKDTGLDRHVEFVGKQLPPAVARLMQESAVLVLPSRAESLGVVLIEAMACGTPVVSTRCGGPEDIVTDEVGVLVPIEDPEKLAAGLAHVLDYPQNYPPQVLRDHALRNFGLDSVGEQLMRVYEDACGRRFAA